MTTPSLDIRAGCARRRARLHASGASVVVLVMLGACADGGGPGPLVAGGHLTAGLAALAPGERFSAGLWVAPTLGPVDLPVETPNPPLPAFLPDPPAPRPPPLKPTFEAHLVWLPELRPAPPTALTWFTKSLPTTA